MKTINEIDSTFLVVCKRCKNCINYDDATCNLWKENMTQCPIGFKPEYPAFIAVPEKKEMYAKNSY